VFRDELEEVRVVLNDRFTKGLDRIANVVLRTHHLGYLELNGISRSSKASWIAKQISKLESQILSIEPMAPILNQRKEMSIAVEN
jgi:hypothetical protein